MDFAQESVKADLVFEALDARDVAVVGFVLLDGEVRGVEESGELEGRGEVGGGIGGGYLCNDEDGEGEGREDEGEGGKGEVAGSHGCVFRPLLRLGVLVVLFERHCHGRTRDQYSRDNLRASMDEARVNIEVLNWRICVVRPTKFIRNGGDVKVRVIGFGGW